jgi:hypothetical protein
LCKDKDSTHRANACPQGKILYHATPRENTESIICRKLQKSSSGRLGAGVYFADKESAYKLAAYRHPQGGVVLKCNVALGRCKKLSGADDDTSGSWQTSYDSATTMHPAWYGASQHREWCLKDERKASIISYKEFEPQNERP